jgi:hypothetical protein
LSFVGVFDIVVKVIASLLIVVGLAGMIVLAIVGWSLGPWWSALIWSMITCAAIYSAVSAMIAAHGERLS